MLNSQKHKLEIDAAKSLASSVPRTNVLRYSLVRQMLWGVIDKREFGPIPAYSGAGQKGISPEAVKMKDWSPAKQKKSDAAGERGGALVPGWWIVIPEKLAKNSQSSHVAWGAAPTATSLRLVPYQLDQKYSNGVRNSFYIHGNGGKGSDGCILIGPTHRTTLVDLVVAGNGAWLHAYISGKELADVLEKNERYSHTA